MDQSELPLINIFEVETDEGPKHLVGFMDTVLAGAVGLASHAMIGEFRPDSRGEFDPETFTINPEFIHAVIRYMNGGPASDPIIIEGARQIPGQRLYIVDPRNSTPPDDDPPAEDVIGWFLVDDSGQLTPDSFHYNPDHLWFSVNSGISGLLADRNFYEYLHPEARSSRMAGGD